jgi:alkylation response protein AidB-like acyl-CoA dehydrogenase
LRVATQAVNSKGIQMVATITEIAPRRSEVIERLSNSVERFVREAVVPFEKDPRCGSHGPSDKLVQELRDKARDAGVLTPHIRPDGTHLSQRDTAEILIKSGLSPLGPIACNTMSPDEGNMYLLGKVASAEQKTRFLDPLVSGRARSAFLMNEPAEENPVRARGRRLGHQREEDVRHRSCGGASGHRHGQGSGRRRHVPGRAA